MIDGLGEWFSRTVWESGLGEQFERVAVNMKNKVKNFFQCAKKLGRVQWDSSMGEQFWRVAWESSLREYWLK